MATLLIIACAKKQDLRDVSHVYNYNEDFNLYMKNTFPAEALSEATDKVMVVQVTSCTPCVDSALYYLSVLDAKNCEVILVGMKDFDTTKVAQAEQIRAIRNKWPTHVDFGGELYSYATNMGKPTLLLLEKGKVVRYIEMTEDRWDVLLDQQVFAYPSL